MKSHVIEEKEPRATPVHTTVLSDQCECEYVSAGQVNNAGCMVGEREMTEDGLEKNFATNTLGQLLHHTHTHDGNVACC